MINFHKPVYNASTSYSVSENKARRQLTFIIRIVSAALLVAVMDTSAAMPESPRKIEVAAKRFAFEPAEITLKKGEAVDIVLTSVDVAHGVRIRELNLDLRAGKGKSAETILTPTVVGTFVGHCSVFCGSGHGQMTLTIHVVA